MKVILVTGGLKGIGRSIRDLFQRNGYEVITCSRTQRDGENHLSCDVSNEDSVKEAINIVAKKYGQIDCLVNSAGVNKDSLLIKTNYDDLISQINTNLIGSMLCCKHALRVMIPQKQGCILNVGSIIGTHGNVGQCAYSASKAGLVGFTKSLAKEVASRVINVNLIAPGFITTDMTGDMSNSKTEQVKRLIPLRDYGKVEDVAQLAYFLAQSSYITGQVIYCDGGLHLNL